MHHPRRISGPTARVVIIGAGLAGLSAALHLRGAGHEVTVLESADVPGGLVRTDALTAADGSTHRFDTGATILTMPDLALDALAAAGVDRADAQARLDLRRVDPSYLCLLYTSDAADELPWLDLGGRRVIKKKNNTTTH